MPTNRAGAGITWAHEEPWWSTSEVGGPRHAETSWPQEIEGRYVLGRLLGRGGAGAVFEARDVAHERIVAVKLCELSQAPLGTRLRREATALRHARLPGVVRLLDDGVFTGPTGPLGYVVMDRVHGLPFPGCATPCTWAWLGPLASRLAEVLAALHFAGLVHRDLKPANLLVHDGSVTLIDFGLARGGALLDSAALGHFEGTPHYTAPEQITGVQADARADLYSVGAMLFEALTGRPTHPADTPLEVLESKRRSPAPSLAGLVAVGSGPGEVPAAVVATIDALLAVNPAQRPASAVALLDLLGGAPAPFGDGDLGLPAARPATEQELRALFHGPDRVLHLQSDGAAALFARTGGHPAHVRAELSAWLRAGLGYWQEGRMRIDRRGIELLEGGLRVGAVAAVPAPASEPARLVLEYVASGLPWVDRPMLLAVTGWTTEDLEPVVDELVASGRLWTHKGSWLGCRPLPLDPERMTSHLRALSKGRAAEHPIWRVAGSAGVTDDSPAAGITAAAAHHAQHGSPDVAGTMYLPVLRVAREHSQADQVQELLTELTALALADGTVSAIQLLLVELGRQDLAGGARESLDALARAALARRRRDGSDALRHLDRITTPLREDLEAWRRALRIAAVAIDDPQGAPAELEQHRAWAEAEPERRAHHWHHWRNRLAYAAGHYREAAIAAELAAVPGLPMTAAVGRTLNAAAAWLEVPDLARARSSADRVRALLCTRQPVSELHLAWLDRAIAYRSSAWQAPDPDLSNVARAMQSSMQGTIALTEGGFALRAGAAVLARRLFADAAAAHAELDQRGLAAVAVAGQVLAGGTPEVPADEVAAWARASPEPDFAVQALGVLGQCLDQPAWLAEARGRAATSTRVDWTVPLDLLSYAESTGRSPLPQM